MEIKNYFNDELECILSRDQVVMIKNCLGEICFGIELGEFQTRIGFSRDEVGGFVKQLKKIIDDLGIDE